MKALGEAASKLPWLVPGAAALVQLTRPCAESAWDSVRFDPAAICLLLRSPQAHNTPLEKLLGHPANFDNAQAFLDVQSAAFVNWNRSGPHFVYRKCLHIAALAQSLAETIGRCDANRAWAAGLLAPLGWLAICAVEPRGVLEQLNAFAEHGYCASWQCETWGLDHAALTRQLTRRWRFPPWLASVVDYLGLPFDVACRLGADPMFFQIVQLAVTLCQRDDPGLGLIVGTRLDDLCRGLDLSGPEVNRLMRTVETNLAGPLLDWQPPSEQPLLADLLRLASELSRQREASRSEVARPAIYLGAGADEDKLHADKMAAVAELAAGAGHEINNPLAVISGQAQYIARQLDQAQEVVPEEPALTEYVETLTDGVRRSLKTIIGQSQRIHQVLIDLMAFARPAPPSPESVSVGEMMRDVCAVVENQALARKVRLLLPEVADNLRVTCDPNQTRAALIGLLRNAVDATPPDGWAAMRAQADGSGGLKIIVEDNGAGPLPAVREHMFDPFFSGRAAGRGRGLGLSIAWRLIHQQHGELSFEGHLDGVTRFAITLPGLTMSDVVPEADSQRQPTMGKPLACAAG